VRSRYALYERLAHPPQASGNGAGAPP